MDNTLKPEIVPRNKFEHEPSTSCDNKWCQGTQGEPDGANVGSHVGLVATVAATEEVLELKIKLADLE